MGTVITATVRCGQTRLVERKWAMLYKVVFLIQDKRGSDPDLAWDFKFVPPPRFHAGDIIECGGTPSFKVCTGQALFNERRQLDSNEHELTVAYRVERIGGY